ncbi:MAG: hypothetical protein CMI52_03955 [Parcubacteria group bacterium]|nr:hypothetical protein [Parcubacteria group bacterium]
MNRIKKQLILALLSFMLVSGIFVDPNITYASSVMEMSQHHDMSSHMSCENCAIPRDMQDCARHCLQQTTSHLNDFRFIHQTVIDDVLANTSTYNTLPKIDNFHTQKLTKLTHKDTRLITLLTIQKRE